MHSLGALLKTLALVLLLFACATTPDKPIATYNEIFSPAMQRYMPYAVYTPPNWTRSESLPLVILLHGARDSHKSFDKHGIGQILDREIQQENVPRAIVVIPEGELGFWENWYDGSRHYRDWVVRDLMPQVARQFNTLPCPDHCHITGISMGAHGAMRFAYYEPGLFDSVAAISGQIISKKQVQKNTLRMFLIKLFIPTERIWGDIDGDDSHVPEDLDPYVSWIAKPSLQDVRLLLTWGDEDYKSIVHSNAAFQQHLEQHGRAHQWYVYSGEHKWRDWGPIIAHSLRFHIDKNYVVAVNGSAPEEATLP